MEVYSAPYTVRSRDVNMFCHMRLSQMMELMQEAATDHSEALGAGISDLRKRGLMWVLARQYMEIDRLPLYAEQITVETWPVRTVHSLYPRYYRILDGKGDAIVNSSSVWMLADAEKRTSVTSAVSGVSFDAEARGFELPLSKPRPSNRADRAYSFSVPFSYTDLNGHMNNTRYFDLADDLSPFSKEGIDPKKVFIEYSSELLPGNEYQVFFGSECDRFVIAEGTEKHAFQIVFEY